VSQSFRQLAEESVVEMASSQSSLDFCAASTKKIDEALAKAEREAAERDELGERIAEVAVWNPSLGRQADALHWRLKGVLEIAVDR
jgi:hypothetical protein